MHRSHTCGELTATHIGQTVTLAGWVNNARDMGWLIFVDLRDRYGITQLQIDPGQHTAASDSLKFEWVIKVTGTVVARPQGQENGDMATWAVELDVEEFEVLNKSKVLPFPITDEVNTSEENRFKYRFLDLRRQPILDNVQFRAKMCHFTRNWFTEGGFLEVQTPIFSVSSPEGARDFVIPSRLQPGKFYALPQAPQQYKQLLMVGGIDKYFQIAPCFRDEDPRKDRHQCEFYQVDLEMSFVEQEDVLQLLEAYSRAVTAAVVPEKRITTDFPRITYKDAMDTYGSDRPDIRFGMHLIDLSEVVAGCEFGVFANAIKDGWVVKWIKLDGQSMTRKEIDALTEVAKHAGAWWLAYMIFEEGGIRSPIAKFFSEEELAAITSTMDAKDWDMVFFGVGKYELVCKVLDKVRMSLRDKYELVNKDDLAYCIIIDFPFYEWDESNERIDFGHNPFSVVVGWKEALENTENPLDVMTHQYDVVLNGYELGSGSIRNHDPEVLVAAFEKVWLTEQDVKDKFGAMYEAFQYGCPPHGWFAFGLDRHMMILRDEESVRECYAFPKSWRGEDLMMSAPAVIDEAQLEELKIQNVWLDEE